MDWFESAVKHIVAGGSIDVNAPRLTKVARETAPHLGMGSESSVDVRVEMTATFARACARASTKDEPTRARIICKRRGIANRPYTVNVLRDFIAGFVALNKTPGSGLAS